MCVCVSAYVILHLGEFQGKPPFPGLCGLDTTQSDVHCSEISQLLYVCVYVCVCPKLALLAAQLCLRGYCGLLSDRRVLGVGSAAALVF